MKTSSQAPQSSGGRPAATGDAKQLLADSARIAIIGADLTALRAAFEAGLGPNDPLSEKLLWPLKECLDKCPMDQRPPVVSLLIEMGCDPMHTGREPNGAESGYSCAIETAFARGLYEEARLMMASVHFDPTRRMHDGRTTLAHKLVNSGSNAAQEVRALDELQHHFDTVTRKKPEFENLDPAHLWKQKNDFGHTPAMPHSGSVEQISWMLDHPSVRMREWLEVADNEGQTLLFKAVSGLHLESTKALVSAGARVDALNKEGVSVMEHALDQNALILKKFTDRASNSYTLTDALASSEAMLAYLRPVHASLQARGAIDSLLETSTPRSSP